jgi:hypothetical protein
MLIRYRTFAYSTPDQPEIPYGEMPSTPLVHAPAVPIGSPNANTQVPIHTIPEQTSSTVAVVLLVLAGVVGASVLLR